MRKGVILEINDLYLTLLTPEGEFLQTRKLQQDYQVGEEIHFFPEISTVNRKKFNLSFINSFKARTIALTAALMMVMTAFIPVYQSGQVYAYMSIDVNPSIELAVSDELKVLRLTGYNPEGKEIIEELDGWKKKDAAMVAEMIIDKIEDKGFFKQEHNIVIATVHNGKVNKAVDRKLDEKISEIKKATQVENHELKVMQGTSEDRKNAKKQGLTTGVYKEKQIEKAKPVSMPAKQQQNAKPEAAQKKPVTPLKPQPKPKQKETVLPKKQEAPGQIKKTPEPSKTNPGESNDINKGQDKKDQRKKNNENMNKSQGDIHNRYKDQKYGYDSHMDNGRNDTRKKNSNTKQKHQEKSHGQSTRHKEHNNKK
jgi:hypothetical protein